MFHVHLCNDVYNEIDFVMMFIKLSKYAVVSVDIVHMNWMKYTKWLTFSECIPEFELNKMKYLIDK